VQDELSAYGWSTQKVQKNIFSGLEQVICLPRRAELRYQINHDLSNQCANWTLDGYTVAANTEIVAADLKCVHSLYE